MNSFWRILSLGGALAAIVVAGIWVAIVLFPTPKAPATKDSEPADLQGAGAQPGLAIVAPTVPSEQSIAPKTVEQCQEEWRAIRAAGQKTTTEKAYVAGCRAGGAAAQTEPTTTAPLPSFQKSVEQCQEEWRAMRAANDRTTTEKAYVAKCRAAATATSPALTDLPASPSGAAQDIPAPAASPTDTAHSRRRIIQR
jgi:hypothetical protein